MEMVGFRLKVFFAVVSFSFFVRVIANGGNEDVNEAEIEVEIEVDTKEEKEIMEAMDHGTYDAVEQDIYDNSDYDNTKLESDHGNTDKDAIEVEIELDTKEEMKIMEDMDNNVGTQSENDYEPSDKISNEITAQPDIKDENTEEVNTQTEDPTSLSENNNDEPPLKKPNENTQEIIEKFKEPPRPLWKIKDFADNTREAGFNLTAEEMKKFKIWDNGVIPYYIDVVSFSDKILRDKIRSYLQTVNVGTGVNFVELPAPPNDDNQRWVFFINRRGLLGCADHSVKNFTNQGAQRVILGYSCMETQGELAEAVMSILGVPAQHNAPDRDTFITVNLENIMPDKKHLFEKLNDNEWIFHDLEYDFNSITHYDLFKYSVNGRPTIQLKDDSKDFSPARTMSPDDQLKIKMLYNYITRNAQMHGPTCEKLFKPQNDFEKFVPKKDFMKPRNKPSRYLSNNA